jgi:hypothetical protein
LAPGGGFVFATIHNIQDDIAPERIEVMLRAVRDYGRSPQTSKPEVQGGPTEGVNNGL